ATPYYDIFIGDKAIMIYQIYRFHPPAVIKSLVLIMGYTLSIQLGLLISRVFSIYFFSIVILNLYFTICKSRIYIKSSRCTFYNLLIFCAITDILCLIIVIKST